VVFETQGKLFDLSAN